MSFDLGALRAAVAAHGRVARVVVAEVRGSVPREPGAAMLVWPDGQSGTIGGGALELEAARAARRGLAMPGPRCSRHALGPDMGQCCGGAVTLWTENFDAAALDRLTGSSAVASGTGDMPLAVRRALAGARNGAGVPRPSLIDGWMVEPVHRPAHALWIWGAGHVGRALVTVLSPLPQLDITWIDTAPDRFPDMCPDGVTMLPAAMPEAVVAHAPPLAHHLVLTYSHALDLELCHRLLGHGFATAGLIGSATKWARFRRRLAAMGHPPARIARITCPIGEPGLGKHPAEIAIGVGAALLANPNALSHTRTKGLRA